MVFLLFFYENIWALLRENLSLGFLTELDSNQRAKLQRLARIFIFLKSKWRYYTVQKATMKAQI